MHLLLIEIRRNPLLWLLVFVPVVLFAEHAGWAMARIEERETTMA